ncbi:MAG: DUF4231 domain-containing protein [Candidatus Paceibacterota bacterium]|jgi:hypothetical protein
MIEQLRTEIEARIKHHYIGQRLWSFAHHGSTFGIAILGVTTAALSQLDDSQSFFSVSKNVWIAVLSLITAILAAVAGRGAFERKWITNRHSRSRLEQLRLDLFDPNANATEIKDQLKRIIGEHDQAITGNGNTKNVG